MTENHVIASRWRAALLGTLIVAGGGGYWLGQRGGEVMGMRWEEVDLKAGLWHLPGARTKNGRPHSVPLPSTALALLERRRDEVPADASAVFPGLTQWSDDHRALSAIHGGAYTWKDLRRTVSTRLAARGFSEEVIGRALNHARYTVTARHYIKHGYEAEVRHALEEAGFHTRSHAAPGS